MIGKWRRSDNSTVLEDSIFSKHSYKEVFPWQQQGNFKILLWSNFYIFSGKFIEFGWIMFTPPWVMGKKTSRMVPNTPLPPPKGRKGVTLWCSEINQSKQPLEWWCTTFMAWRQSLSTALQVCFFPTQSAENHRIFISIQCRLFSLRLRFERSKLESLRDVRVTRIGDTLSYGFPQTGLAVTEIIPLFSLKVTSETCSKA